MGFFETATIYGVNIGKPILKTVLERSVPLNGVFRASNVMATLQAGELQIQNFSFPLG